MQTTLPGFPLPPVPDGFSDQIMIDTTLCSYRVHYDREVLHIQTDITKDGIILITSPVSLSVADIRKLILCDEKKLIRPLITNFPSQPEETEKFFSLGSVSVPYRVRISNRAKYMSLKVNPLMPVIVVIPSDLQNPDILSFLEKHQDWIAEKLGRPDLISIKEEKTETLEISGHLITYKIRRSSRAKRLIIRILGDQSVEVVIPPRTSSTLIQRFVTEKASWILKMTTDSRKPLPPVRRYRDGDTLPLLGREMRLSVIFGSNIPEVRHTDDQIITTLPSGLAPVTNRELVKQGYQKVLTDTLMTISAEMIPRWSSSLGINVPGVKFGEQKTRWGVCTPKGIILNIRLAMAPLDLIEYVIVHELCHVKHPDHSSRFWGLVGQMLPDYLALKNRLKRDGVLYCL
ncbi:MAG: M48 family metallopeptidase [Methanospirillum sp.]|uniref:M48 family metallopeptidase n=1 Tax=Methanospirillum sp. TaxID=45200 RepID=UPI002374C295|nr:SprT family zinc-dependent metalloprotease [Methanospirillum sp.]MDD1729185.1 M48 family metallopeptidase [Methanospirillum sp.]